MFLILSLLPCYANVMCFGRNALFLRHQSRLGFNWLNMLPNQTAAQIEGIINS
jgi:hypothetical protein